MCTKIRLRPRTIIWYNDITGQNESSSYYIIKQGKLEVNIEISVLEMSEIWLLQVSLEDHARHHHLTWELIMDLQYSISIIIVLLTSYLWDLDIRRAVYVIGFELQCKISLTLILHLFVSNVTLSGVNSKFAKHHEENTAEECHYFNIFN